MADQFTERYLPPSMNLSFQCEARLRASFEVSRIHVMCSAIPKTAASRGNPVSADRSAINFVLRCMTTADLLVRDAFLFEKKRLCNSHSKSFQDQHCKMTDFELLIVVIVVVDLSDL